MRSIQGRSGGKRIDPKLQKYVLVPDGSTDHIHHVGSTYDYRSTSEGGPAAGGIRFRQGRQICFFTAVDHMNVSLLTLRYEPNEPREIQF